MPQPLECPRCKTPLRLSKKLAGAHVQCPHCKVRLWVAKDTPADAVRAEGAGGANDSIATQVSETPRPQPPPLSSPPALPLVPARRKKVARFITADTADSALRLAADGKLPTLHLEDDAVTEKPEAKQRSVSPIVMLGLLSFSVVLSVVLALVDWERVEPAGGQQKSAARQRIEDSYFGADNVGNAGLEPYQLLLREAQRAYTRGDHKVERDNYRKVLEMLRAERGSHERGLTGSRTRDRQLEEAISVLLRGS